MGSLGRPGIHVRVILPVPQQHREHQNRGPGVTHCLALRRPHWHPHAPFLIKLSRLHVDLRKNRRQGAGRSVQPTGIVVVPSRCFGGLHLCHVHFQKNRRQCARRPARPARGSVIITSGRRSNPSVHVQLSSVRTLPKLKSALGMFFSALENE